MSSDDDRNPLDVLKPGDLDALIKPPEKEDAPEISGQMGDFRRPPRSEAREGNTRNANR